MTTIQARQLLEVVVPLAKGLAFTQDEFMAILNICDTAIDRLMRGENGDEQGDSGTD